MPSLQETRRGQSVCSLDNKMFSLGGVFDSTCELLDLSEDDPQWRYFADMNTSHSTGGAVVIEKKIYVLGGCGHGPVDGVEVYDEDQGMCIYRY